MLFVDNFLKFIVDFLEGHQRKQSHDPKLNPQVITGITPLVAVECRQGPRQIRMNAKRNEC